MSKKLRILAICYLLETFEDILGMLKFGEFVTFCKYVMFYLRRPNI